MASTIHMENLEENYQYIDESNVDNTHTQDRKESDNHVYQGLELQTNIDPTKREERFIKKALYCQGIAILVVLTVCVIGFISLTVLTYASFQSSSHSSSGRNNHSSMDSDKDRKRIQYSRVPVFSLVGYNILRGFPFATGHDPGFTIPIYVNDYTDEEQIDYPYRISRGFSVVPGKVCKIAFDTSIAQTGLDFASLLTKQAQISRSGWGPSFLANPQYKYILSQLNANASVIIHSSSECHYFQSMIFKRHPPKLHPYFKRWLEKLAEADNMNTYIAFFNTFGTHFPTRITYGAKTTYQYRISPDTFNKSRKKITDITSYSLQGDLSPIFSNNDTKVLVLGAPLYINGSTEKWLTEITTNHVPIKYDLHSIEYIFNKDYINISETPVNLSKIIMNIKYYKYDYCRKVLQIDDRYKCREILEFEMNDTRLFKHKDYAKNIKTIQQCNALCQKDKLCFAVTYCMHCSNASIDFQTCYKYGNLKGSDVLGGHRNGWLSFFHLSNGMYPVILKGTKISDTSTSTDYQVDKKADLDTCLSICLSDPNFVACTYRILKKTALCKVYDKNYIFGLELDKSSVTIILPY